MPGPIPSRPIRTPGDRTPDGREPAAFAALRRLVCRAGVHRGGYGVAGAGCPAPPNRSDPRLGARLGGEIVSTVSRRPSRVGRRLCKSNPLSSNRPNLQEPKPTTAADAPTSLALARIEARLGEFGQRLGETQPRLDQDDQQVAQLRRDLDGLRQEVKIAVRASKQESQELSMAVREILQLLRRLTMQSRATEPMQVPVPIPFPPEWARAGSWPRAWYDIRARASARASSDARPGSVLQGPRSG